MLWELLWFATSLLVGFVTALWYVRRKERRHPRLVHASSRSAPILSAPETLGGGSAVARAAEPIATAAGASAGDELSTDESESSPAKKLLKKVHPSTLVAHSALVDGSLAGQDQGPYYPLGRAAQAQAQCQGRQRGGGDEPGERDGRNGSGGTGHARCRYVRSVAPRVLSAAAAFDGGTARASRGAARACG